MNAPPEHHVPILDAALAVLERELGKTARLRVRRVNVADPYAFVYGSILGSDGRFIDYAGTPFAEAAQHGGKSFGFTALLGYGGGGWQVLEHSIGATDMGFLSWAQHYRLSPTLLNIPVE